MDKKKKLMDEDDMDKLFNLLCDKSDNDNVLDIFNSIDKILPHLKIRDDNIKNISNPL
jgi:hypothetical protein